MRGELAGFAGFPAGICCRALVRGVVRVLAKNVNVIGFTLITLEGVPKSSYADIKRLGR